MHRLLALGAPEYVLKRQQWVPAPLDTVFAFFLDPHNLPRITPPSLGFHIVRVEPPVIRSGTRIDYRLHWMGVPYHWQTLIVDWEPGWRFVDTQERGPYILWHHTHTFETQGEGVLLSDLVRYRLPFGPLGVLARALLVRRQLDQIFDYRTEKIAEIFSAGVFHRTPPEKIATAPGKGTS